MTGILCDLREKDSDTCEGIEARVVRSLSDLRSLRVQSVIADPRVIQFLPRFNKGSRIILVVGSFDVINLGGLACQSVNSCTLYAVPIPLSNDAFCMGRCSTGLAGPSIKCKRASRVYLVLRENNMLGVGLALLGLGEAFSAVCSLRESLKYGLIGDRYLEPVDIAINYIENIALKVIHDLESSGSGTSVFRYIFSALLTKCSVASYLGSHEHVARSDHSIGRVLEQLLDIPHGAAVLLGCKYLSRHLLKPQEEEIVNNIFRYIEKYNNFSLKKNLPEHMDIVKKALMIRPTSRNPLLLDIKQYQINFGV